MDIIVRGEAQEIDFVRRLCRDKVRRGLISILPATSPACDEVVRLRNERDEMLKQLRERDARISELESMLSTEVNLDDVKDVAEADTKEAPAPTPKKTRSKKSE